LPFQWRRRAKVCGSSFVLVTKPVGDLGLNLPLRAKTFPELPVLRAFRFDRPWRRTAELPTAGYTNVRCPFSEIVTGRYDLEPDKLFETPPPTGPAARPACTAGAGAGPGARIPGAADVCDPPPPPLLPLAKTVLPLNPNATMTVNKRFITLGVIRWNHTTVLRLRFSI